MGAVRHPAGRHRRLRLLRLRHRPDAGGRGGARPTADAAAERPGRPRRRPPPATWPRPATWPWRRRATSFPSIRSRSAPRWPACWWTSTPGWRRAPASRWATCWRKSRTWIIARPTNTPTAPTSPPRSAGSRPRTCVEFQVQQAEADLADARSTLVFKEDDLRRDQRQFQGRSISESDFVKAQTDAVSQRNIVERLAKVVDEKKTTLLHARQAAEADMRVAKADLEKAKWNLDNCDDHGAGQRHHPQEVGREGQHRQPHRLQHLRQPVRHGRPGRPGGGPQNPGARHRQGEKGPALHGHAGGVPERPRFPEDPPQGLHRQGVAADADRRPRPGRHPGARQARHPRRARKASTSSPTWA